MMIFMIHCVKNIVRFMYKKLERSLISLKLKNLKNKTAKNELYNFVTFMFS